jgi:hypothetical protein
VIDAEVKWRLVATQAAVRAYVHEMPDSHVTPTELAFLEQRAVDLRDEEMRRGYRGTMAATKAAVDAKPCAQSGCPNKRRPGWVWCRKHSRLTKP